VGEPTLLLHAGVFGAWFQPVASHVGGRVIRVLRAGYADGPPPTALVSQAQHAAHAAALLDALGTGPATVVGHSSSTLIVLELATARPDLVRRMVLSEPPLIDPLLDPADVAEVGARVGAAIGAAMAATARGDRAGAYDAFMGAVCGPAHRRVVAEVLGADGLARAERDARFFFTNEVPGLAGWTPPDLSGIPAQALLVAGAESPGATQRLVEGLAGRLPHAEVARIAGANHLLPLTHPREVADLVTAGSVAAAG